MKDIQKKKIKYFKEKRGTINCSSSEHMESVHHQSLHHHAMKLTSSDEEKFIPIRGDHRSKRSINIKSFSNDISRNTVQSVGRY